MNKLAYITYNRLGEFLEKTSANIYDTSLNDFEDNRNFIQKHPYLTVGSVGLATGLGTYLAYKSGAKSTQIKPVKPISDGWGPLTYIGAYGVDSPKVDAAITRMVDSPEKTKLIKNVKNMRKHLRKVEQLEGIGKTAADVENALHGHSGINPYPLTMNQLEYEKEHPDIRNIDISVL